MSAVHGVVILADQRWEAPIIQAIQSRADALAIVRRCADLAEVIAAARAGVADLAVIDGADPDLTAEAVGPEYPGRAYTDLDAADWVLAADGVPVDTAALTPAAIPCPAGYTLYKNSTPQRVAFTS